MSSERWAIAVSARNISGKRFSRIVYISVLVVIIKTVFFIIMGNGTGIIRNSRKITGKRFLRVRKGQEKAIPLQRNPFLSMKGKKKC